MDRSVGEVARLAGVSVRTKHHYDEVGLLRPSDRSAAGYRVYSDDDLVRLQHILGYRELGSDSTPSPRSSTIPSTTRSSTFAVSMRC